MVKSKSSCLAKLPKEQRCQFLIGPISSWFMPNTSDIWTQPNVSQEDIIMDCDQLSCGENASLSYFIYGSIGCFCYGEIHHHNTIHSSGQQASMSAVVTRVIDIKEDNSRVSCIRFLKTSVRPFAMALTESGSFLVHDCVSCENLVHFRKSELIARFVDTVSSNPDDSSSGEHCSKKAKFNVTQQINSCTWPTATNAFLAISLVKEKTNLLVWLKVKDVTETQGITKTDFIESHRKLELDLPQYSRPVCCMESAMLDSSTCLIAIASDDGLITVVSINLDSGKQSGRVIKLARHDDQVSSLSFYTNNTKKFPLGILASVSRDGLALVWDIENEFYFADYQASSDGAKSSSRINWFSLCFSPSKISKHVNLLVSNSDSGLTVLELPENARSKIRLKEKKDKPKQKQHGGGEQTLRHHALIFNVAFDPITETVITSSLDGNHILWKLQPQDSSQSDGSLLETKPQFLFTSMPNTSRTHMLRHSPIREDLLGMALGKAGIRFYKIAKNSMDHRFDMSSSCGLIARKINKASFSPTSLAWHPSHEYRVAIGTLEGKVLRADLTPRRATLIEAQHNRIIKSRLSSCEAPETNLPPRSNESDIFDVEYQPLQRRDTNDTCCEPQNASTEHYKTDGIYSMCWGPNPVYPQDISKLAIYAVGSMSKRLFIYQSKKDNTDNLTNYLDEFLDQSLPEAIGEASEVAWKSSMDLMALGTTNGKIIIASYLEESHADRSNGKLFKKLAVIQGPLGHTYIQCLAWHPTTDMHDSHYYCIAASANESPAFVFNIKENLLADDVKSRLKLDDCNGKEMTTANIVSDFVHKLEAHKKAISDMAWNPHKPYELATSSFDRQCYIWSLDDSGGEPASKPSAQITSKFSARDRLFTLEWSLVDSDLIFTSGHDSTIWAWRPSENPLKGGDILA